ncbi:RNA polymerase sigma factor [Krasilnikoviella flava]|uniref:RNA polymerase, sigma subunit, ECF family n=1 Tax=Krasilnikoviella flava TaxID=526729 RepID=A0A1T5LRC1_9MICO|nr:sigma-70 family RNA polymerase sigma factor [Krasilnikoviella flava]SKC78533.1 RNA polymerase, sigma subunit, ECF family [Krasilnikoviella flava]
MGRQPPQQEPETANERFASIFGATRLPLLAYAVRRLAVPEDAADVVAETFLIAWRRLDEVPPGEDARPWLFGVARGVLANHQRGERRRIALAERLREDLRGFEVPRRASRLDDVERAMASLPDDDREILRLVAWEELARDEIALVLGVSRGAVRVRLHRARKRLAQQMSVIAQSEQPAALPAASTPVTKQRAATWSEEA